MISIIIILTGLFLFAKHHLIDFNDGLIEFRDILIMLSGAVAMVVGL